MSLKSNYLKEKNDYHIASSSKKYSNLHYKTQENQSNINGKLMETITFLNSNCKMLKKQNKLLQDENRKLRDENKKLQDENRKFMERKNVLQNKVDQKTKNNEKLINDQKRCIQKMEKYKREKEELKLQANLKEMEIKSMNDQLNEYKLKLTQENKKSLKHIKANEVFSHHLSIYMEKEEKLKCIPEMMENLKTENKYLYEKANDENTMKNIVIERLKKKISDINDELTNCQNINNKLQKENATLKIKEKNPLIQQNNNDDTIHHLLSKINYLENEIKSIIEESEKQQEMNAFKDVLIEKLKQRIDELRDQV